MLVEKSNERFSFCHGFSKMASDMSLNGELTVKYGAGNTKITQIIRGKGNQFSVLKKPNVHNVCFRR